ncbi:MAG: type II toxin-antitoxin system HicB family antitoxin [Acidobacteria bacterium]|nr:type II toxin-antitoxin system HicB family antitoxin [Acidobacteriota bacterium]
MLVLTFTVHVFKEGTRYVAYVPELDVSSRGATDEEARKNIRDAVEGFIETSADMGTLEEILEEAGYVREGATWQAPELVSFGRMRVSVDGLG